MQIYLEAYDRRPFENQTGKEEHDYQHRAGHRLVRYALMHNGYNDKKEEIIYAYNSHGKPFITGRPDIQFNLSHTSGMVACVVSRRPAGIDVEAIRPVRPAILRRLTEGERNYILSSDRQEEAFMRVWTMKEAYLKMKGIGIVALNSVECIPGRPLPGAIYRQFIWQNRYVITGVER